MERLRIIIADDESIIRMDLKEMLEEAGHSVVAEAVNGRQAVEFARKLFPDLLILDVKMPVMDGLQAAELIAAEHLAPVILLTAFSQKEFVDQAGHLGVLAYLVKPLREEQLLPAIEIAMARFGDVRDLEAQILKLQDTLEMRKAVERAKGILVKMYGYGEEVAYRKMQQYAMDKRVGIKNVAQGIIKSYENGKRQKPDK